MLNRFPSIQTPFPGATPEQVESLVTEPIESKLSEVAQIGKIESVSGTGLSVVSVELDDSVTAANQNEILAQIREKLDQVELPGGVQRPDLSTDDGGGAYTLMVSINAAPDSLFDAIAMGRLANDLADELRRINGTETVEVIGQVEERITVSVDPTRLAQTGLRLSDVAGLIQSADINGASGVLRQDQTNLTLNMAGTFETLDRIRQLPLRVDGALDLRVQDIATVARGWMQPLESETYFNDRPGVVVAARVGPQVRVDNWTARAMDAVDQIAASAPSSFKVQSVFEQRGYISDRLSDLAGNLIAGAGIVFVVVMLFMGWRAALIVGSALPLTFAGVLFGLSLLGVQIHQMSVFGMIIALGLLIDNAIVMVDEVRVRMHDGTPPSNAIVGAVGYLSGPLFASTLTTVLGFAPILLLQGAIGDFIKAIAISVTLALIVSYVISMTLIPALAGRYPGRMERTGFLARGLQWPAISNGFRGFLTFTTRWTPLGIGLSMIPAVAGFALVGTLGMQFFPAADRDHFEVKITFPPSQSIDQTRAEYDRIYDLIRREISPIAQSWVIGRSHPAVYYNQIPEQRRNDSYLHGVLTFESAEASRGSIARAQALLDQALPSARVVALPFGQGPPVAYPLAFRIFGSDLGKLAEIGSKFAKLYKIIHKSFIPQRRFPRMRCA